MAADTDIRPAGVLEHLDPNSIVVETNVRLSAPITKEFVQSIRDHGVMVPILGHRDHHGNVLVRAGQRRTLGAREAGAVTIPVYVVDGDAATTARIVEQLIENEQREALTDSERAAAWQQLAFEGLSATAIAKRTGTKAARVKQGLAVAESVAANAAVVEHQLDLEQAATLIEFEDDPEATAELIEIAKESPAQFGHAAQRVRDERERRRIRTAAEAEVAAQGFAILESWPSHDDRDIAPLYDLRNTDGNRPNTEEIATLDGASARVRTTYDGGTSTEYFLRGWAEHGYTRASGISTGQSGPMTDEQKAERKKLIANNKAWASAETVRRQWLTEFLTRKTLPKDAAHFIARGLTFYRHDVQRAMQEGNALAHDLLQIERGTGWRADHLAETIDATPNRAQHITLAVVTAGIEAHTDKGTWRHPDAGKVTYFQQLATWGYTLSDVEQLVIDRYTQRAGADAVVPDQVQTAARPEGYEHIE